MDELARLEQDVAIRGLIHTDTFAIIQAAASARERALALPPITRNGALKAIADQLLAIELLFKRQGAELVQQNSVFLERLHTLGEWGLEYDALEDEQGKRTELSDTRVTKSDTARQRARQVSSGVSPKQASRYVAIGIGFYDLQHAAEDRMEEEELSLRWALSLLEGSGEAEIDWLRIYNVWYFHALDPRFGVGHPGNVPGQIVQNLNWYYTKPGDLVVDIFAGGGTTLDVCKFDDDDFGNRECLAYDIEPHFARNDIKRWDVVAKGLPKFKHAQLVFLDPPYWKQKKGEYSGDATNLANLGLNEFHDALTKIVLACREASEHTALIIGATFHEHEWIDHASEVVSRVGLPIQRIVVPYTTQQYGGAHVLRAKEKHYMLNLYRDLMVWQQ